jgi:nuclease S1
MGLSSRPRWSLLMRPSLIRLLVPCLLIPTPALAWGKAGHRVVATLAMSLLTPDARTQVADLLGPNVTLAAISTWADEIRSSRPNTGPWHYVNIPRDSTAYDAARDCSRGCVVSAIEQSLRLLHDTSKDRAVREEALRWIVHFVADLHQPLHVIGEDRGGNDVLVRFNGRQTNLHRLWDGDLIDHVYPNATALYKPVQAVLQSTQRQAWDSGSPADWALETHRVAPETVYPFPDSRVIDDRYVEKALPVIYEQLAKAAVRLAGVVNRMLRAN